MNPNLTTPPNATVPGPIAAYDTVTINPGGKIMIYAETNVSISALVKTTS